MSEYPMNATDCYQCEYFLAGGHYDCQKRPRPHHFDHPTDDPQARYFVPCPVDWQHPDGLDTHCNSFVEHFKDTLF